MHHNFSMASTVRIWMGKGKNYENICVANLLWRKITVWKWLFYRSQNMCVYVWIVNREFRNSGKIWRWDELPINVFSLFNVKDVKECAAKRWMCTENWPWTVQIHFAMRFQSIFFLFLLSLEVWSRHQWYGYVCMTNVTPISRRLNGKWIFAGRSQSKNKGKTKLNITAKKRRKNCDCGGIENPLKSILAHCWNFKRFYFMRRMVSKATIFTYTVWCMHTAMNPWIMKN